jgi:hypothetical protein
MMSKLLERGTRNALSICVALGVAACGGGEMQSQALGTSSATAAPAGAAGMKATSVGSAGAASTSTSPSTSAAAAGKSASSAAAGASAGPAGSSASAAAAGTSAGAAGSASGASSEPSFSNVYDALFSTAGAGGCYGCHGGIANPALNGNLAMLMDKAATYKALVGTPSSPDSMCKEMTRVTAGDPMKSLLYLKISGMPPCGMEMPPGSKLPDATIALVKDWITAGAKDD